MVSIILSVIAMNVIGMVWYSDKLFGRVWLRELGINKNDTDLESRNREMKRLFLLNLLFTIGAVMALHMILKVTTLNIKGVLFAWVAFSMLPFSNSWLWEKKSIKAVLINAGCNLLSLLAASIIILSV